MRDHVIRVLLSEKKKRGEKCEIILNVRFTISTMEERKRDEFVHESKSKIILTWKNY